MQLIDKTVDCQGSHVVNEHAYHEVILQRRWMALSWLFAVIGLIFFVVAIFLPDWAIIDFTNTHLEHVHIELGVWGEWRSVNTSTHNYYRAQATFCVIAVVLMIFTNGMALYSFTHHRYMFKRLVAFLYLFCGMCMVMTVEILINSVDEWNIEVAQKALDSDWDYSAARTIGHAVYMAWVVVGIHLMAAIAFAIGSHKQKGSRAATAEFEIEDRPVYIGRD